MPERSTKIAAENLLTKYLRERHMRQTSERLAILGKALSFKGHFTPCMLFDIMSGADFKVSRGTVYNNLALFVDAGIFAKQRSMRSTGFEYELSVGQGVSHIHLVCHVCGKIKEVRNPDIFGKLAEYHFPGFGVNSYNVSFVGVCSKCQRQLKKSKQNISNKHK